MILRGVRGLVAVGGERVQGECDKEGSRGRARRFRGFRRCSQVELEAG
jgi:hypothetical protein